LRPVNILITSFIHRRGSTLEFVLRMWHALFHWFCKNFVLSQDKKDVFGKPPCENNRGFVISLTISVTKKTT
jgi:hypothetical protein